MKAERRHELQTNALARFLENVPLYFQFHFWKIVAGALVIVLVILLVRYRISSARESEAMVGTGMAQVRDVLEQLPTIDLRATTPADRAAQRRQLAGSAEGLIEQILQQTDDAEDAGIRAEALVARGDLYWTMANLPPIPGSATQPSLQMPQTAEQYLEQAEQAYQLVVQMYPEREISAVTAMFGLAAIAENRQQWDDARAQYQSILKRPDLAPVYEDLANWHLAQLETISRPVYMGTLTTQPATQPTFDLTALPDAAAAPTTAPATAPATQP